MPGTDLKAGATLPDFLAPDLALLAIGLNPSLPSVRAGVYFANPRNRFWPACQAAFPGLANLSATVALHERLLEAKYLGFTDVAKRPSAMGSALRTADFRADAPRLLDTITRISPAVAWFHGKVAYRAFAKYSGAELPPDVEWGEQPTRLETTRIHITPNPSPANAAYSLADLTARYAALAATVAFPPFDA